MACRVIINGVEYVVPQESVRIIEDRIRLAIDGIEAVIPVQLGDTDETIDLHILPGSISTFGVSELR